MSTEIAPDVEKTASEGVEHREPHKSTRAAVNTILTANAEERALLWKQDIRSVTHRRALGTGWSAGC